VIAVVGVTSPAETIIGGGCARKRSKELTFRDGPPNARAMRRGAFGIVDEGTRTGAFFLFIAEARFLCCERLSCMLTTHAGRECGWRRIADRYC